MKAYPFKISYSKNLYYFISSLSMKHLEGTAIAGCPHLFPGAANQFAKSH